MNHPDRQVPRARMAQRWLSALTLASLPLLTQAATKDIVLDRLAPSAGNMAGAHSQNNAPDPSDAMVISVLVESADGSLTPRSTQAMFRTGERLRIKVLASRSGKISVHNTNPAGVMKPVWDGEVQVGQETISPRMVLTGLSGQDQLHVVLEPATLTQNIGQWLSSWFTASKSAQSKDIRLDSQSTQQATYVLNPNGQGIVSTVRIVHK